MRVGAKYWGNPIIIKEREMYWKTDGAYISPNNVNLLRKGGLLETLLDCPTSKRCSKKIQFLHCLFPLLRMKTKENFRNNERIISVAN